MMKKEKNIVCLQNEKIRLKQKRTIKEWADFACNTNPKAKCRSQWNGDEISFCHWEAESAQDILDWFDEIGLKDYMSIELHEQWRFHSYYDQSDKELVYKDY